MTNTDHRLPGFRSNARPERIAHFLLLDRREAYAVAIQDAGTWVEPASYGESGLPQLALSAETWELLLVGGLRLTDALTDGRVLITRRRAAAQRFARSFDARRPPTPTSPGELS